MRKQTSQITIQRQVYRARAGSSPAGWCGWLVAHWCLAFCVNLGITLYLPKSLQVLQELDKQHGGDNHWRGSSNLPQVSGCGAQGCVVVKRNGSS